MDVRLDCRRIAWVRTFAWNFSWRFADFEKCSASSRPALVSGIFQNRSDDRAALLVYYILPRQFHVEVSAEWMAILAFSLWVSAEFSDIVRGALESVPKHQREAGLALGLTKGQLFVHVLMPQAFMLELPAAINLATRVVKTTSLLMIISVMDVINVGQQIIEANNQQYQAEFLDLRIYFHAVFHR